jgi:hypothetical protein
MYTKMAAKEGISGFGLPCLTLPHVSQRDIFLEEKWHDRLTKEEMALSRRCKEELAKMTPAQPVVALRPLDGPRCDVTFEKGRDAPITQHSNSTAVGEDSGKASSSSALAWENRFPDPRTSTQLPAVFIGRLQEIPVEVATSSSAAAASLPAPCPQVDVAGDTSGSTAAGVSLLRRPLHKRHLRERLIAEVRIKMICIVQAANEQMAAERDCVSPAVIDVEKPKMDINGVLFRDKGPRDHKICEQVFKPDKKRGEVTEWVVDIGWQDKYIWEIYPDHLDFSATKKSEHHFQSHSDDRTDGCGLAIWNYVHTDDNDDFKCPGYSKSTAKAAAAMPTQQLKALGDALVTICRHNGAKSIRMKDGYGLGCDSGAWFLLEDIARLDKRHFGGCEFLLNKSVESANMEIIQAVICDLQHGKCRFQIGIEVYQEGGGFSGDQTSCYSSQRAAGLISLGSGNVATALEVGSMPITKGDQMRPFCIRATTGHSQCSFLNFARMSKELVPEHILEMSGVFHMTKRCNILSIFKLDVQRQCGTRGVLCCGCADQRRHQEEIRAYWKGVGIWR